VWFLNVGGQRNINSLTPKSILAGRKNSRLEGFWLAKHKPQAHKPPHHDGAISPSSGMVLSVELTPPPRASAEGVG